MGLSWPYGALQVDKEIVEQTFEAGMTLFEEYMQNQKERTAAQAKLSSAKLSFARKFKDSGNYHGNAAANIYEEVRPPIPACER